MESAPANGMLSSCGGGSQATATATANRNSRKPRQPGPPSPAEADYPPSRVRQPVPRRPPATCNTRPILDLCPLSEELDGKFGLQCGPSAHVAISPVAMALCRPLHAIRLG